MGWLVGEAGIEQNTQRILNSLNDLHNKRTMPFTREEMIRMSKPWMQLLIPAPVISSGQASPRCEVQKENGSADFSGSLS
jgi:hypothetical protein